MHAAVPRPVVTPPGPAIFDSIRDYVRALEARGRVLHVEAMDQDQYEVTAFAYRLIDKFGIENAPAFMVDRIRINGQWMEGPLLANPYGRWPDEAVLFGVPEITSDYQQMYHAVMKDMEKRLDVGGSWKRIPPVELAHPRSAPCKQVILKGDAVDIEKFAWLKNNPADAGRYINITSVIMDDPEFGKNTGTYRCQVRDGKRISINPEPTQHGWRILTSMRKRGDKVAIAVGADPFTVCASSTKMAGYQEDELEFAGGLRDRALEVVKCETSDIRVPAHAEMIIEGEVPLDEGLDEGPYGEMYGYLGPMKPNNFFINIKCITHRAHLRHAPLTADCGQLLHVPQADSEPDGALFAPGCQRRDRDQHRQEAARRGHGGRSVPGGEHRAEQGGDRGGQGHQHPGAQPDPPRAGCPLAAIRQPDDSPDPDDDAGPQPPPLGALEQDDHRRHPPAGG